MGKICSKCHVEKPVSEYHKRTNRPRGVRSQCKECYKKYPVTLKRRDGYMREYDLLKSYGITVDEYELLHKSQDGNCAICRKPASERMKGRKKYLCVDHCHDTGKIRGLLCDPCNRAIGLLQEDCTFLLNAINYLRNSL